VENPNLWRGGTKLTIIGDGVEKFISWRSPLPGRIDAMRQVYVLESEANQHLDDYLKIIS
jgi:hypothetical protein